MYTIGYHQFRYKSMFKNKLVMGFYESPRFFDSIKDTIREDFSVEMNSDYVKKIAEDILQQTAIAVGVRRGTLFQQKIRIIVMFAHLNSVC